MKRALTIACLSTALLLPASAEAAKMRFGGKSSAKPAAETSPSSGTSRSLVIVPGVSTGAARAGERAPSRIPSQPVTATATPSEPAPALLKLTVNDGPKVWCRSEVVIGGFCVLN
jgi:hypothetical protein